MRLRYVEDGRGNLKSVYLPGDDMPDMMGLIEALEKIGPEKLAKVSAPAFMRSIEEMRRTETAQQRPIATETNVNENGTEGDSGMNRQG